MTILLLFITCIGMYGMMLFIIEQKNTELGIRKVLGASLMQLQIHLYQQYIWIVLVGFAAASLIAFTLVQHWLEGFAYRIEPQIVPFVGSGLACMSIVFFDFSAHLPGSQSKPGNGDKKRIDRKTMVN